MRGSLLGLLRVRQRRVDFVPEGGLEVGPFRGVRPNRFVDPRKRTEMLLGAAVGSVELAGQARGGRVLLHDVFGQVLGLLLEDDLLLHFEVQLVFLFFEQDEVRVHLRELGVHLVVEFVGGQFA